MTASVRSSAEDYCPGSHRDPPQTAGMALGVSTLLSLTGAASVPQLTPVLAQRASVLALAQAAEDAVLRPVDPGGWSHEQRAALAARVALLNGARDLAEHYAAQAGTAGDLANPAFAGTDPIMRAALRFVDGMAQDPKDMEGHDLARLRGVGVTDSDIVRLAELVAFLSCQLRLVSGLRLLMGAR